MSLAGSGDIKKYNTVREYTLDDQQIETIWETVGGSAWEIYSILEDLFQRSLQKIVAKIKRERIAMIIDVIRRDCRKEIILKQFLDAPVASSRKFMDTEEQLLGELVRDNILYYDPADGAFGVQGKSLEWGIQGYFDEE